MSPNCPDREKLLDFTLGRMGEVDSEAIAAHVNVCPACEETMAALDAASDTLVAQLREPAVEPQFAGEPEYREALRRVKARAAEVALAAAANAPGPSGDEDPSDSPALGTASASQTDPVGGTVERDPGLGRLGEYELLSKLGEGGMGAVYKARQTRLDKIVAIKILPKERTADSHARARFEREMRAVGRVSHPNIVQAMDARDIDGTTVLVMEYADGVDLSQIVSRLGLLPIAEACELMRQAALGLQCAHENGLVHRDIKPSNLMLTQQGIVKILDLGLARLGAEPAAEGELTSANQAMGTADYMAPEQTTDSHSVDIRADIYSLGCTLYKLLTGQAPFTGPKYRTAMHKMVGHLTDEAPPIQGLRSDVPGELAALVHQMLAKSPDARPASPAAVATALEPFSRQADLQRLQAEAAGGHSIATQDAAETSTQPHGSSVSAGADREAEVAVEAKVATSTAQIPARPKASTRHYLPWVAVGIAMALLGGGIYFGVTILLRDRSGKEVGRITVPEAVTAEIVPEKGKPGEQEATAKAKPDSKPTEGEAPQGSAWPLGPAADVLPGLVPQPASLPGIHRWQAVGQTTLSALQWLAFSPDGRLLACAEWDGARVYDTRQGRLVRVFPAACCQQAVFSPGGKLLAVGERDKSVVRLFDVGTGEPGAVLQGNFQVSGIDWAPDGNRLAVAGGWDGMVRVWTLDGKLQREWKASGPVERVAWSPDGKWIATGVFERPVQLFSPSGEPGPSLEGVQSRYCLAWSPNGRYLAGSANSGFWVCDASTRKKILSDGRSFLCDVSWGADNRRLAVGAHWASPRVWDVEKGTSLDLAACGRANLVAWDRQGDRIAAAQGDAGLVAFWRPNGQREESATLGDSHQPHFELAASPRGPWIATYRPGKGDLRLWSEEGRPGPVPREKLPPFSYAVWSPEGDELAIVSEETLVRLWQPGPAERLRSFRGHTGNVRSVAWSPDGKRLVSGSDDKSARVWDCADGSLVNLLTGHAAAVHQVAFSPDGKRIASRSDDSSENAKVRLWSAEGGAGPVLQSKAGAIAAFAWSPDSRKILTHGNDRNIVEVWNAAEGEMAVSLATKGNRVRSAGWSPDGQWIWVVNEAPFVVQLFNRDGAPGTAYPWFHEAWSANWSPDGKWFAVADNRGTIWVFSPSQAEPVRQFRDRLDLRLHWNADSRHLLTLGPDRTLRGWNALNGTVLSTGLILPDGEAVWFSAAGKLETTAPNADKHLAVVVERTPGGAQELWTFQQFQEYLAKVGFSRRTP